MKKQTRIVILDLGLAGNSHRAWDTFAVFAHVWSDYHLKTHPYFKAENNFFGLDIEIASSGFFHYYSTLAIGKAPNYVSSSKEIIVDAINQGIWFEVLNCNVPYQKPVKEIEDFITGYWALITDVKPEGTNNTKLTRGQGLKKSITLSKLQRLLRWGYKQAKNLIPYTAENLDAIRLFLSDFDKITAHKKYTLSLMFKSIEFEIRDGKNLEWDAFFIKHNGIKINYKQFNILFPSEEEKK